MAKSVSPAASFRRPQVLCHIDLEKIELAAGAIHLRLYELDRARGIGGYVFADPTTLEVYVIPEDKPALHALLREIHRNGWLPRLVGRYCTMKADRCKSAASRRASVSDLTDDLAEHLAEQLGIVHE